MKGVVWLRRLTLLLAWWLVGVGTARAGELRVEFLDVGQGDAELITSPTGKTVLIDGGPPEASRRLAERAARLPEPIDLVLLSHRHSDHLGGLRAALQARGARLFLDASFPHPSPLYDRLLAELARQHIPVRNAVAGRTIDLGGGAVLTLLGPPEPALRGTRSDVNANSVVARLDYGETSFLFCGDAEAETEAWLLRSGRPLRAQVVKMAHHGSRYASTPAFIAAVHAELAVASAGQGNSYGHPHAEALARWSAAGAHVYRTDRDGAHHQRRQAPVRADRGGSRAALLGDAGRSEPQALRRGRRSVLPSVGRRGRVGLPRQPALLGVPPRRLLRRGADQAAKPHRLCDARSGAGERAPPGGRLSPMNEKTVVTRAFVDEVSGGIARLLVGGKDTTEVHTIELPASLLPLSIREGSFVELRATLLPSDDQQAADTEELRKRLSQDDDGGDITL